MTEIKIIVVGAGLVGSLFALFMSKKGHSVEVYEKRQDPRKTKGSRGRSINLALSYRGRKALRYLELEEAVLEQAIPMKGRMLHTSNGKLKSVPYDSVANQCIFSVGRTFLNTTLLNALERFPNVSLNFGHEVIESDIQEGYIRIKNRETKDITKIEDADLIVGADGAFSCIRRHFQQQVPLFNFSQNFIEHGYVELEIPPQRGNQLIPNHLHIWPRGEFMMIALPNKDNSWTVTLFMPFSIFEQIESEKSLICFFQKTFPDSIPLMGIDKLVENFFRVKPSSLISIKCGQLWGGNKFLLIGDAAHAMVPFYGQGMNAGFEDCTLFNEIFNVDVKGSIEKFSRFRVEDVHEICDLAMYNYLEMRDFVTKPSYLLRKAIDNILMILFPKAWVPLYNSVSFSDMPYGQCRKNREWQNKLIRNFTVAAFIFALIFSVYIIN